MDIVSMENKEWEFLVRLLNKSIFFEGNYQERIRVFFEELSEYINVKAWIIGQVIMKENSPYPVFIRSLSNLPDHIQKIFIQSATDPKMPDPSNFKIAEYMSLGKHFTVQKNDLVTDKEWYRSPHVINYRQKGGVDEFIYSVYPLESGCYSTLSLHRIWKAPKFTKSEKALIHLIMQECKWLHYDIPQKTEKELLNLKPRLHETFMHILDGHSTKDIASKMNLSEYTVKDYTKELLLHFQVESRTKLISNFWTGKILKK